MIKGKLDCVSFSFKTLRHFAVVGIPVLQKNPCFFNQLRRERYKLSVRVGLIKSLIEIAFPVKFSAFQVFDLVTFIDIIPPGI